MAGCHPDKPSAAEAVNATTMDGLVKEKQLLKLGKSGQTEISSNTRHWGCWICVNVEESPAVGRRQ